jgi:hypothetical protein
MKNTIVFVALFAALAAGCTQPLLEKTASVEPEAGVVQVSLGAGSERTLLPSAYEVNSLYYTLAFNPAGGPALADAGAVYGSIAIGSASGEFTLATGTWNLAVRGFASQAATADPANALVSGGKNGIEISSAAGTSINVALSPDESKLTQVSMGILSYDISFPNTVHQAALTVYDDTDTAVETINLLTSNTGTLSLDSGVYNLGINLYKTGKAVITGTTAHIYDGLTTRAVYSFTNQDFADFNNDYLSITTFSLSDGISTFNSTIGNGAIFIFLPPGTNTSGLTAVVEHTGLVISSNPATPDWNSPVTYMVTRENGETQEYTVMVRTIPEFTNISDFIDFLGEFNGYYFGSSPIPAKISVNLADAANGWTAILSAIKDTGKFVDLDLSGCTMAGTEFDPGSANTGEWYITGLVLPDTAISIKASTFSSSSYFFTFRYFINLKTLSGSGVKVIGYNVFSDCTRLESVNLPEATYIEGAAFSGCTSLESVNLPEATCIESGAFFGCTRLESVNLPEATYIGYSVFSGCTRLESVSLPEATDIGNSVFSGCTSLESVNLPEATYIGNSVFSECTSLESADLPEATYIGYSVFSGCTSLSSVFLPALTVLTTSLDLFSSRSSSGGTAFVITLGASAPHVEHRLFNAVSVPKTVTVKVPYGATGYGSVPATYSGTNTASNWGNAFRGKGWDGTSYGTGTVNSNITLYIEYITP